MGNNGSNEDNIEEDYEIKQVRQDGSALLKHKKTNQQYQLRSHCSNIEDEMIGFKELLQRRQSIKSTHLLELVQITNKMEKQICSILHKLYLLIEFPFKTLHHEINERKDKAKADYFAEDQLWSILYSCSVGLHTLYLNKFNHESLSSKQVYINKEGLIKISDPILLGLQKNYITVLKKTGRKNAALSPQVMNFLDDCNFSFYDKEASDVFVLGTILLEASLLKQINLYDLEKKRPKLQELPILLQQVKHKYSENYYQMLQKMLQLHSKNRPKLGQIILKIEQENNLLQDTDETQNKNLSEKQDKSSGRSQNIPISRPQFQFQLQSQPRYQPQPSQIHHQHYEQKNQPQLQHPSFLTSQNKKVNFLVFSNEQKAPDTIIHKLNHQNHQVQSAFIQPSQNYPNVSTINKPTNQFYTAVRSDAPPPLPPKEQVKYNLPSSQADNFQRFSYKAFGNVSVQDTKKEKKNDQLFSYDIPQIRDILMKQKIEPNVSSNITSANPTYSTYIPASTPTYPTYNHQVDPPNTMSNYNYGINSHISTIQNNSNHSQNALSSYFPKNQSKPQLVLDEYRGPDNSLSHKSSSKYEILMPQIPQEPYNKYSVSSLSSRRQITSPIISQASQFSQKPQSRRLESERYSREDKSRSSFPSRTFSKHDIMVDNCSSGQVISSSNLQNNDCEWVCQVLDGGAKYEGYKKYGMKNGHGKLFFRDGGFYEGDWKDNKMHGYGKLHYQNGQIAYQGQWVDDEFNGEGRVFNDHPQNVFGAFNYHDFADLEDKWVFYEGDFKSDSKHGKGKIKLTNGQVFQGTFVYDSIEGDGIFYSIKGQAITGYWKDNILTDQ